MNEVPIVLLFNLASCSKKVAILNQSESADLSGKVL